jgi:hypothetical protein
MVMNIHSTISDHFVGNRTQWVTALCGSKHGGVVVWVQIVPGTSKVLLLQHVQGIKALGLHAI